ncbi:hypothetical protein [Aquimarina sp. RZ0]|uniref:hypothetical protein n=1 Tax=Aquimarina sp. RZ0 TaxID=2607730 RepID=UPI0011F38EB0|nr:hypothetical protein [Aquimarina sp. RZ0]KAA1243033.1 hypothetical protein F0000_22995 [Aquimarina sp. RZ0]
MKRLVFTLCIVMVSKTFCQEIDSLKVIEIPESYSNHTGEPLTVKIDSLYRFKTSDIYLVNKKSFLAIKNVYQTTIEQDKMTKELIKKYTQTLHRNIDLERSLKINFTKSDSLDQIVYEKTQATLNNTQKALDYTINSLEKATNSLELVEKATKRQRRKTVFEKILIGVAGIGAGVLVGISL